VQNFTADTVMSMECTIVVVVTTGTHYKYQAEELQCLRLSTDCLGRSTYVETVKILVSKSLRPLDFFKNQPGYSEVHNACVLRDSATRNDVCV
jgi:hypothetical protein